MNKLTQQLEQLSKELEQLNLDLKQSKTFDERQRLINNHPVNKYGFGFSEEVKLLLILKILEIECKLSSDKSKVESKARLMGFIANEIFYHRKVKYAKYDY